MTLASDLFAPQEAPDYTSAISGLDAAQDRITQYLQSNTRPSFRDIGSAASSAMLGGTYSQHLSDLMAGNQQKALGDVGLAVQSADLGLKKAELAAAQNQPDAKGVMEALKFFAGDDPQLRAKLFQAGMDYPEDIGAANAYGVFGQLAGQFANQPDPIDPNKPFYLDPVTGEIVENTPYQGYEFDKAQAGRTSVDIDFPPPTPPLSVYEEKFDEKAAEQMTEWMLGGAQDTAKGIEQLTGVVSQLTGEEGLTGPHTVAPDVLQAFFAPESLNLKQQVQEVVQRNLRVILGAQFTEREGELLIQRAFDPRLPAKQNAERLSRLLKYMVAAAQAKNDAASYINQNRTLMGWQGSLPSFDDLYGVLDVAPDDATGGQTGGETDVLDRARAIVNGTQ
jgi:hypothetical protein